MGNHHDYYLLQYQNYIFCKEQLFPFRYPVWDFLKNKYIGPDGEVNLKVANVEDLKKFVQEKRVQITRMMKSKYFTDIERQGAKTMLKSLPWGREKYQRTEKSYY